MEKTVGEFFLSTDNQKLQFDVIHTFLTSSYWSEGISKSRFKTAVENSLNIGAYVQDKQVGYMRVVTDKATFAYLCDVFVLESERGKGLSKEMMTFMQELPELQNLRRFMLATKDAHGLYSQFGFVSPQRPERLMEITKPDLYKTLKD